MVEPLKVLQHPRARGGLGEGWAQLTRAVRIGQIPLPLFQSLPYSLQHRILKRSRYWKRVAPEQLPHRQGRPLLISDYQLVWLQSYLGLYQ